MIKEPIHEPTQANEGRALTIHLLGWVLLSFAFARTAGAWGSDGHHTVGAIADQMIQGSNAATQVASLLGPLSLQDAAVWADCAKGVDPKLLTYTQAGKYPACKIFETS